MSNTVLFVDDEEFILNSIEILFADKFIRILKATNVYEALDIFSKEKIAVIVSNNHMAGMKGIDLLLKVKDISPDTLRILMTDHADLITVIDAINKGELFRYIIKPWDNNALIQTVHEAIKRYRLVQSLRKEDESILLSVAQTIELRDPYTTGHGLSVASYAIIVAEALNLPEDLKKDLKYGCFLHDCGKMEIPVNILSKKRPLIKEEYEIIKNHPRWGADIALQAQLSKSIVNIIYYHHERYDGGGYPTGIRGKDIPLESRIVTIADVYDALTNDRAYRKKYSKEKAINIMSLMRKNVFDPEILDIFLHKCLKINEKKFSPTVK